MPQNQYCDIRRWGARVVPISVMVLLLISSQVGATEHLSESGSASARRPNIVFLLSDDQRDSSLGGMGHPFVQTPNLDRLGRQGVRFRNCYVAEPTCSPSRTALFTGTHERVNGVGFTSSYVLTAQQWKASYPALLREHGYFTGFIGKFGVEYYEFNASEQFDFWKAHDGWAKFFFRTARNCQAYLDLKADLITPAMGQSMEQFLDVAPHDRPFCLSVSFSVPHGSQTTSMYPTADGLAMKVPASDNPDLKNHPFYDQLYRDRAIQIPADCASSPFHFIPETVMNHDGRGKTYSYDYAVDTCKEHHIRYYQTITGLDQVVGQLIESLERRSLVSNTVILFGSDHGLIMGEYGMGGKALLYDLASKIPCVVYDPRMTQPPGGRTLDQLVSSLDLTATILDYADVPVPDQMEGRSLVPLIEGKQVPWRDELFLENLYTGRDTPLSEGIRRGKWKYIRMYDGKEPYCEADVNFDGKMPDFEQLFDLEQDPGERRNLIQEFEGTAVLQGLRERCQLESARLNQRRQAYRERWQVVERK